MEGGYRTHPFDPMNAASGAGQWLAEQGPARAVAEQDQPLRFGQGNMPARDFSAFAARSLSDIRAPGNGYRKAMRYRASSR